MVRFDDWLFLIAGILFITLACFKLYGLANGIEGGGRKPGMARPCGT